MYTRSAAMPEGPQLLYMGYIYKVNCNIRENLHIRISTRCTATSQGWMDGWVRVLRPFNSISVISRRWKGEHERLCARKRRLGSGRISPPAGFEPATPWSEVGSANRSATRTLRTSQGRHFLHMEHICKVSCNLVKKTTLLRGLSQKLVDCLQN